MYNKRIKIFFGLMAFLLLIGYPLSLLTGFSGFQNLFNGSSSTSPQKIVSQARGDLAKHPSKSKQIDDLRRMGTEYLLMGEPDANGNTPANASENLNNAIAAFQQWIKLDPKNEDAKAALANAYSTNQNWSKAEQIYKALAKDPASENHIDYLYAWGEVAQEASDTATAISAYQQFVKAAPNDERTATAKQEITQLKSQLKGNTSGASGAAPTAAAG